MPTLAEKLADSKKRRRSVEEKFGCLPSSVVKVSRGALSKRMFLYQQETPERSATLHKRRATNIAANEGKRDPEVEARMKEHQRLGLPGYVTGGPNRQAATTMPAELVDFFVKFYTNGGETYLDPFAAQGVQMQVAHLRGLHYWGVDLCAEFMRYCEAVQEKITTPEGPQIHLFEGDSRYPAHVPEGIGDFCFTSPPYWDVENYGEAEGQLGPPGIAYEAFLDGMEEVARAWLPKFKPGGVVRGQCKRYSPGWPLLPLPRRLDPPLPGGRVEPPRYLYPDRFLGGDRPHVLRGENPPEDRPQNPRIRPSFQEALCPMKLHVYTRHLIVPIVQDRDRVWMDFLQALNHTRGVTLLTSTRYDFPGGGFSGIVIIAESHAAIHTWPEEGRAWVELATCGDAAALDAWETALSCQFGGAIQA